MSTSTGTIVSTWPSVRLGIEKLSSSTGSQTRDIERQIWRQVHCAPSEPYRKIFVPEIVFTELRHRLDGDKLRYDYDPTDGCLVIRMASIVHDHFKEKVVFEIQEQLSKIKKSDSPAAAFAAEIDSDGSSQLTFNVRNLLRSPDISFALMQSPYPGVIIEVLYTQKQDDLPGLAYDYLVQSNGGVQLVIGLNILYPGSKRATMSVWRPVRTIEGLDCTEVLFKEFRTSAGHPVPCDLVMPLKDFAEPRFTENLELDDYHITISGGALCNFLSKAEKRARYTVMQSKQPETRKRKRAETPPEELCSEDEAVFQALEDREEQRVEHDDISYNG